MTIGNSRPPVPHRLRLPLSILGRPGGWHRCHTSPVVGGPLRDAPPRTDPTAMSPDPGPTVRRSQDRPSRDSAHRGRAGQDLGDPSRAGRGLGGRRTIGWSGRHGRTRGPPRRPPPQHQGLRCQGLPQGWGARSGELLWPVGARPAAARPQAAREPVDRWSEPRPRSTWTSPWSTGPDVHGRGWP